MQVVHRRRGTAIEGMRTALLAAAVAGSGWLLAETAVAQSGRQIMVMDDGDGSTFIHMRGLDLEKLRRPDYVRDDLPVFNKTLELDPAQKLIVDARLDAYLHAFGELMENELPAQAMPGEMIGLDLGGPEGLAGEGGSVGSLRELLEKAAGENGELGGSPGTNGNIEIMISAGTSIEAGPGMGPDTAPGGGDGAFEDGMAFVFVSEQSDAGGETATEDVDVMTGGGSFATGDPEASVAVALTTPEGTELPAELREALEAQAKAIAEQLQAQIEQKIADGELQMPDHDPAAHMERHRQEMEALLEQAKEFEKAKDALTSEFERDVRSQLSLEQIELWPVLVRTLTRRKTLPEGRLDGERIDLVRQLERMKLDEEQLEAIAEQREAYETSLHEALTRRNAYLEEAEQTIDEEFQAGRAEKALAVVDRATRLRVAVRDVNQQFTEAIAASLDEQAAAAFEQRVLRDSFPRVYRRTRADRTFDVAREMDGLEAEVVASIEELAASYAAERQMVNDRIRHAIVRYQPQESRRSFERMASWSEMNGGEFGVAHEKIRKAFDERDALDERYIDLVESMLTPDQVAELPQPPAANRSFFFHHGPIPPMHHQGDH